VSIRIKNIFSDIPQELSNEHFETIFRNENIKLERIISDGHISPGEKWYDQDFDEWVLVLSGKAILSFENKTKDIILNPGDYIMIKAHEKHRVKYTDLGEKTIWLTLHIK